MFGGAEAPTPCRTAAPKDNMQALELISELIDEAEKCHVDVADTILRALQSAIHAQRNDHRVSY